MFLNDENFETVDKSINSKNTSMEKLMFNSFEIKS